MPAPLARVTIIALAFVAVFSNGPFVRADESPTRSVLIVGDKADEIPALKDMLSKNGYDVEQAAQKTMDADLADYDAVIVYIHSVIVSEVEHNLIDYVNGGGRMLVIHHAIASAKWNNPKWLELVGIKMAPRNDPARPWKVSGPVGVNHTMVNLKPGHFITSNGIEYEREVDYVSPDDPDLKGRFKAFDIPETEIFHHQTHTDRDKKTILFGYRFEDAETDATVMEDTSGWYKPVGRGHLFYLQPGHENRDFNHPQFGQVMRNCLDWEIGKK